MKRALALLSLPLLLAAPAGAAPPAGVTASGAWMRYLLPSVPAGGYITLDNASASPVTLISASSPACAQLMLHQTQEMSGMAMMMAVPSLTIPAHGRVSFAEGGYHLMCMGPQMRIGSPIQVTLGFQGGQSLVVAMPVYGPAGPPAP